MTRKLTSEDVDAIREAAALGIPPYRIWKTAYEDVCSYHTVRRVANPGALQGTAVSIVPKFLKSEKMFPKVMLIGVILGASSGLLGTGLLMALQAAGLKDSVDPTWTGAGTFIALGILLIGVAVYFLNRARNKLKALSSPESHGTEG